MSRGNIVSILPDPELLLEPELALVGMASAIIVTFQTKRGLRSYRYSGAASAAILSGSDPSAWYGEEV